MNYVGELVWHVHMRNCGDFQDRMTLVIQTGSDPFRYDWTPDVEPIQSATDLRHL
jgi:hypothetical protein